MGVRVFNWVSYGSITTYLADTPERLRAIYDEISAVMNDFTENEIEGVKRVDAWLKPRSHESYDPHKVFERAILMLIDEFGGTDVHETFEHGTGFDDILDPLEDRG